MKKKLLLIALPALMALSGCANIQKEQPKVEEQPAFELEEDTVAHEEIFGEAIEAKQPAIRKMDVVDTETDYKIGYQIHYDGGTDKISIRFIAAINAEYSSMVWSRGVATKNGSETKAYGNKRSDGTTPLASTVVYTSLCNGEGNDVMEANQGDYAGYTGFIVYSIRNIPYDDNKDSYIGVSLSLDAVQTDFYAVKIEKNGAGTASANSFSIPNDVSGFVLAGTLDGKPNSAAKQDKDPRDGNVASFTSYLASGDEFVVAQKTSTIFKVWAGSCLGDADERISNTNGKFTVSSSRRYVFYLNDSNGVYHTAYGTSRTDCYLRGPAASGDWADLSEDSSTRFYNDPDNDGGFLRFTFASTGTFKLTNQTGWGWAVGYSGLHGDAKDGVHLSEGASDDNIMCSTPGTYDFYVNSGQLYAYFVRGLN